MNAREKDAHLDLCRRLATALNERDAARAEVAGLRERVEAELTVVALEATAWTTVPASSVFAYVRDRIRAALTEVAPE